MEVFLDAEAREELGGVALGVPSVEFGKFLFKFGSAYAVFVGEVGLGVEGILFLHDVPQHGVSHEDGVEHSAVVELVVVL